jgi:hypothetical protein
MIGSESLLRDLMVGHRLFGFYLPKCFCEPPALPLKSVSAVPFRPVFCHRNFIVTVFVLVEFEFVWYGRNRPAAFT